MSLGAKPPPVVGAEYPLLEDENGLAWFMPDDDGLELTAVVADGGKSCHVLSRELVGSVEGPPARARA